MNQQEIIYAIIKELKQFIDPIYREGEKKFFKEPIHNLGVRLPQRRLIARQFWPQVKKLPKKQLWQIAEQMFSHRYGELATIAAAWVYRRRDDFTPDDFLTFFRWVDRYFDNWGRVDDFCTHSLGYLINHYPNLAPKLLSWTKSKNRWVKRAAAVSLIYPWTKPKKFLPQILKTAEVLLIDADDLVQKGYGWMLKEASVHNQKQIFAFVMKHKARMPRTALRYAIEKMPVKLKKLAMRI